MDKCYYCGAESKSFLKVEDVPVCPDCVDNFAETLFNNNDDDGISIQIYREPET